MLLRSRRRAGGGGGEVKDEKRRGKTCKWGRVWAKRMEGSYPDPPAPTAPRPKTRPAKKAPIRAINRTEEPQARRAEAPGSSPPPLWILPRPSISNRVCSPQPCVPRSGAIPGPVSAWQLSQFFFFSKQSPEPLGWIRALVWTRNFARPCKVADTPKLGKREKNFLLYSA